MRKHVVRTYAVMASMIDDRKIQSMVWKARMTGKVKDMSSEELEAHARAVLDV